MCHIDKTNEFRGQRMKFYKSIFVVLLAIVTKMLLALEPIFADEQWGVSGICISISVPAPGEGWKQGCHHWTGWAPSPEALSQRFCEDVVAAKGFPEHKINYVRPINGWYPREDVYEFDCEWTGTRIIADQPWEKIGTVEYWRYVLGSFIRKTDFGYNPLKSNKDSGETVGPSCRGNPIYVATGEKFQIETDYRGKGPFPLVFQRSYNSQSSSTTSLGLHWRHNYDLKLLHTIETDGDEFLTFTRNNGKLIFFTKTGISWVGDLDIPSHVVRIPTGWELHTINDEVETYDNTGKLVSIRSRAGLIHTLTYDEDNRLRTVTDSFGNQLQFSYDEFGRLGTMTAPGNQVYTYTQTNTLTHVTYPDTTTREYLYSDNRLTGILDEKGNRFASWTYDIKGRAISSEHAGGAERVDITYNDDGTTSVSDSLGSTQTYHFANVNGVRRVTQIDGGPCQSCGGQTSATSYDANGFINSRTDFNGNTNTYINNARGLEISRIEAMGTPQERTVTTEWHPQFRLPTKIIELGKVTTLNYDTKGNLLSKIEQNNP